MARLITQLNAAGALAGTEVAWIEQGGLPVKATLQAIADLGAGLPAVNTTLNALLRGTGTAWVEETSATLTSAGALTALSYGGIVEGNLLDKSATENISGAWTFGADLSIGSNKLTTMESLQLNTTNRGTHATTDGLMYYDVNITSTDIPEKSASTKGGLTVYNSEDSWSMLIDTQNMVEVAASFSSLAIASTALVTNLNADRVDSLHATSFLRSNVADDLTGAVTVTVGPMTFNDNVQLRFGTGAETYIMNDGLDMEFYAATGSDFRFFINSALCMRVDSGAAVTLGYNAVDEFRTSNSDAADNITGAEVLFRNTSWQPVGLAVMPTITKSSAITISELHMHHKIRITNVTGTITFPNDTGMVVGSVGWIVNTTTSDQVLGHTSNNLEVFSGDGVANATGNMTLAGKGWCTWTKQSDTQYELVGVGLS